MPAPAIPGFTTPDWVKHAVFYQVFPDRFARGSRITHPTGLRFQEWGAKPTPNGYQGGDLYGVAEKLDYLLELGIDALYFTPIFASASNHRYHTYDYLRVDPLLGGDDALRFLLDEAHARGVRVVLDGVFNHTGRGFWAFHHILENGGDSPYIDWFHVYDWPLRPYPRARQKPNYACWWNLPDLPKLNTNCAAVREHVMQVAKHWLDFGIDGWRLDVPGEIDDDPFWQEFRRVVKGANPEAYICGEIWHEARRWLQGDQFDAVMNYVFTGPTIGFCAARTLRREFHHPHLPLEPLDAPAYAAKLEAMYDLYCPEVNHVQMTMLDSHDMPRLEWLARDRAAQKLCVLLQMTTPGAPCVYYGDEVGVTGGVDPDCRRAFPWHDEANWDRDLLDFYKRVVRLRREHEVLRTGDFEVVYAEGQVLAFRRTLGDAHAIVVVNAGESAIERVPVPGFDEGAWQRVWPASGGSGVAGRTAAVFVC
jgi:neopullulanase